MKKTICFCLLVIILSMLWGCQDAPAVESVEFAAESVESTAITEEPSTMSYHDKLMSTLETCSSEEHLAQKQAQREELFSYFGEHQEELEAIAREFIAQYRKGVDLSFEAETNQLWKGKVEDRNQWPRKEEEIAGTELNQMLEDTVVFPVFNHVYMSSDEVGFAEGCNFSALLVDRLGVTICRLEFVYSEVPPIDTDRSSLRQIEEIAPCWYYQYIALGY